MTIPDDILTVTVQRLETWMPSATKVVRPTKTGSTVEVSNAVVIVTAKDIVANTELSCPGNPFRTAWDLPVHIAVLVNPSEFNPSPIDSLAWDLGTEAQNAITNVVNWHTFDGNAINTMLGPMISFDPGDDTCRGVSFDCFVTYRVFETDQNQLA